MVPCWEFFLSFFWGVDFLFFPFPFLLPPLSFMMSSAFGSLLYSAWHGASTFRLKKSIISFHFHASAITTGALLTHYYTTKPGYSNSFMSENIQTQQGSCRHLAVPFTEAYQLLLWAHEVTKIKRESESLPSFYVHLFLWCWLQLLIESVKACEPLREYLYLTNSIPHLGWRHGDKFLSWTSPLESLGTPGATGLVNKYLCNKGLKLSPSNEAAGQTIPRMRTIIFVDEPTPWNRSSCRNQLGLLS